MSIWNGSNFYRFVAKVLVFFMVIQGMPIWELSRAYEWEFQPEKIQRVLDVVVTLFSPNRAYASTSPDPNDYTTNRIPGNFVDISDTGTRLIIADEGGLTVPFGFNFEFYGTIFTTATITANGYISFSPTIIPDNTLIPSEDIPNAMIAPFWDDLNPELNPAGGIYYSTVGTEPDRKFIVQWNEVPLASDPDSRLTFEVILFESTNEIQFHYLSMIDGSGLGTSPMVSGKSATIGIENADGTRGNEVAFNKAGSVSGGSAFSFTLAGNAFETGRRLGDMNGDSEVNILDQGMLTDVMVDEGVRASLELVLSDVAPVPGPDGGPFGDRLIDPSDYDRTFSAVMGFEELNPTLSLTSYYIAPPGEAVTLFGSGFDTAAANNTIVFVGVDGSETSVPAESVNADGSEIGVTIPSGMEFISSVRAEREILLSNPLLFLLQGDPLITSPAPDSGDVGNTVVIRGYEFGSTIADNHVLFNGIEAVVEGVVDTPGMDMLIVTVPENVSSGPLTVTVDSQPSNEVAFIYDGPPLVLIASPEEDGEITSPAEIIGTASDLKLVNYTLEYAPVDGDFTTFASGTDSIEDDVLGSLDPTLLKNGFYQLRLTAEDENGNVSSTTQGIMLTGDLKAGVNKITFTDLQVPVSGIPITVRRTYDSRVKTKKDFGVGWSLEILDLELYENQTPGDGWYPVNTGAFFPNWELRSSRVHLVLVTFPDGRTDVFEMKACFEDPVNRTGQSAYAVFEPRTGTTSTLDPLGGNDLMYSGGELLYITTYTVFNPDRYLLTTKDGTKLVINQATGLESIRDTNGNYLSINSSGIIHSSGKSISFTRDVQDRIIQITDPMGNTLDYTYDGNGDLVSFTDRENYTTTYTYDDEHNLIDYTDPRGVTSFSVEYNEEGRLLATRDANGNRIELTYDLDSYTSVVRDRLGNATVYEYNARGDVTFETDPLGNVRTYTYDANGNKLSETDPLGNVTTFTYDANNNMISETDPLGNTTLWTYDGQSRLLSATDPLGNTTNYEYDTVGNLLNKTDPMGCVATYTYDSRGHRLSATDCTGNTTTYEYDSFGNKSREVDALGNETTYSYDANGNELSKTTTRTNDAGMVTMTITKEYDSKGRVIATTDPDGNTTVTEYSAIGKKSAEIDKNGNRTEYTYDDAGNPITTTSPDGSTQTKTYDANGNMLASIDKGGLTTSYEYDAGSYGSLEERRMNRLTRLVNPDGSSKGIEYDAVGRIIATVDENGNRMSFEYDAASRKTRAIDALGNETTFTYDASGNQLSMTDANGNKTTYEYDALNRRTRTILPDGTFTSVEYASASCQDCKEKKASETDQAGNTTRFEYDALGQLTRVIDALGGETTYTYDEVGNKTTQTDANGNTTRWTYDNLGRVIARTLPMGQTESYDSDANGNILSKTDFNGDTTTYAYDTFNRFISKSYPDGSGVTFTYTTNGQRETVTDARGVTSYSYDSRGRLTDVSNPDGTGITYTYDPMGNRTSVTVPSGATTYTYDELNRLETVTDPDGGVTTYAYDNVGNRAAITYPNGTITEYTYNSLNRLINLTNRKSAGEVISSYAYTLGPVGNRLSVTEDTGRIVDYTYDALYRLTEEDITDPALGNETISYTYDPVGNRMTKTDSTGLTTYVYNENDQLLTEAVPGYTNSYSYDSNGNMLSRSDGTTLTDYFYDYENRMVSAQTGTSISDFAYDSDGIRVRSETDGNETNYLVDKNRPYAQVLEETDGSGILVVSYVYGDDLISQSRSGVLSYYHYDGQMSTRKLTDASETATDSYLYDAFGVLLDESGSTDNTYLYTGEQYDPNVGFYYLRARYYNQETGRFMTHDPRLGNPFDPLSLHRYLYANASPMMFVDRSGEMSFSLSGMMTTLAVITIITTVSLIWASDLQLLGGLALTLAHGYSILDEIRWDAEMYYVQVSVSYGGMGARLDVTTKRCGKYGRIGRAYRLLFTCLSIGPDIAGADCWFEMASPTGVGVGPMVFSGFAQYESASLVVGPPMLPAVGLFTCGYGGSVGSSECSFFDIGVSGCGGISVPAYGTFSRTICRD